MPSSSCSCKSSPTKKRHISDDMDWYKTFKDVVVTDVKVADLKNGIQVENPFAFGK